MYCITDKIDIIFNKFNFGCAKYVQKNVRHCITFLLLFLSLCMKNLSLWYEKIIFVRLQYKGSKFEIIERELIYSISDSNTIELMIHNDDTQFTVNTSS